MKRLFTLMLPALVATTIFPSQAAEDPAECVKNFTVSGSFFSGKQFKTSANVSGVKPDAAFKKAYISLTKKGYQIVQADKELGVISAAQQVTSISSSKTAPLNVLIEAGTDGGSKASFSFSISGGLATSSDGVRDEFCAIIREMATP